MHEDATPKVSLELVEHEGGQFAATRFQIGKERRPVLLYRSVEQSRFRTMALVCARGCVGLTACWLRGKHQQEFSAMGPNQLLPRRSIRENPERPAASSVFHTWSSGSHTLPATSSAEKSDSSTS
jgi:hypothetical protein